MGANSIISNNISIISNITITNINIPLSKYLVNRILPDISNDIDNIADIISALIK